MYNNLVFSNPDIFNGLLLSGFLINRICAGSLLGLARAMPSVAESTRKWATTGLGLGVIPFIVHPIDSLVHIVMDNTTRQGSKLKIIIFSSLSSLIAL